MNSQSSPVTPEVSEFIENLTFEDIPAEALRIGKRCVLDGVGVILAGSLQQCTRIVRAFGLKNGKKPRIHGFRKRAG